MKICIFLVLLSGVTSPVEDMAVVRSVYLNFYMQYFILSCMYRVGGGVDGCLINQPTEKKERPCVCLWPNRLLSQATNSQNSVSTRPTQARIRPGSQLTTLFHAVLCCAIRNQDWLERLAVHFYLVESSVRAKRLCKKKRTEQTNKCSSHLWLLCLCGCMCVCVCATCLCLQTCTCTVHLCMHVSVYMCVFMPL